MLDETLQALLQALTRERAESGLSLLLTLLKAFAFSVEDLCAVPLGVEVKRIGRAETSSEVVREGARQIASVATSLRGCVKSAEHGLARLLQVPVLWPRPNAPGSTWRTQCRALRTTRYSTCRALQVDLAMSLVAETAPFGAPPLDLDDNEHAIRRISTPLIMMSVIRSPRAAPFDVLM